MTSYRRVGIQAHVYELLYYGKVALGRGIAKLRDNVGDLQLGTCANGLQISNGLWCGVGHLVVFSC